MKSPITDIDTLTALAERINSGDASVYDEIAELLARTGFTVRAAFTGSPPPGFLAAYVRGDLQLRPHGPVARALGLVPRVAGKAAATQQARKPQRRLITRKGEDGRQISVDNGLLRELKKLDARLAEGR